VRAASLLLALLACIPACDSGAGVLAVPEVAADPIDASSEDAPDEDAVAVAQRLAHLAAARAAFDAGAWDGGDLYAAAMRTSVMNEPAWPDDPDAGMEAREGGPYRLGYVRHGSHVPFFTEPVVNEDCPEGWFELIEGGFVCGKYTSPDPKAPSVKFAANPPNLVEGSMPYKYGYAVVDNTPVYRRVLSLLDRQKYEPELIPAPPDAGAEGGAGDAGAAADDTDTPADETVPERGSSKSRHPKDAGPPVKLGDLRGRGVLVRRMMKGFYVALDRAFNAAHARWWRTSEGFAIPFEKIALQGFTPDFHGSWVKKLDPEKADGGEIPEGSGQAAMIRTPGAATYLKNDKGHMAYGAPIPKWTALELSGEPETVDGVVFDRTTSGFWVRRLDLMLATPEPPADVKDDERWIDVDLGKQLLVAFEGLHPVYATRVSSGRRFPWDPTHDHPTPTGSYRIYEKHISTTMDGDVASDGPYSIEDVPWVMYFLGSYALHGAFWHNLFGSTRSHGCINLSPIDAKELFFWADPQLPKGWHGVFQTASKSGSRVIVHEPPRPKGG
jgi:hypothetical protein